MTDALSQPTFRLVYRSHLRVPDSERKAQLGSIFSAARSKNKRHGVTGALLVWQDCFVQALEGDERVVRDLYDTIYRDSRHERVTLLEAGPIESRAFGRWSMARVSDDDDEPDLPLLMNRDKGGISPAARPITDPDPDTENMLDAMREYARADE